MPLFQGPECQRCVQRQRSGHQKAFESIAAELQFNLTFGAGWVIFVCILTEMLAMESLHVWGYICKETERKKLLNALYFTPYLF